MDGCWVTAGCGGVLTRGRGYILYFEWEDLSSVRMGMRSAVASLEVYNCPSVHLFTHYTRNVILDSTKRGMEPQPSYKKKKRKKKTASPKKALRNETDSTSLLPFLPSLETHQSLVPNVTQMILSPYTV